tara:strand:+ start:21384 stop:21797 length:414 start_codon:yes stop_codon:yes gene_type:complete
MTDRLLPISSTLDEPWYAAARGGQLLFQRSTSTGAPVWYPRRLAPGTLADDLEWAEASGRGTLYSYSIVYRTPNSEFADEVPYVLALVDLDEGVRLTTRIVDTEPDALVVGARVDVIFEPIGDALAAAYFTVKKEDA